MLLRLESVDLAIDGESLVDDENGMLVLFSSADAVAAD